MVYVPFMKLAVAALVLAQTTAQPPPLYAIGNINTKKWISNNNVAAGNNIQTVGPANQAPDNALFVQILPAPGSSPAADSTIYDAHSGLYIGLEEPISPGSSLQWVNGEYHWWIAKPNGSPSSFVIYTPGQDYYWFDNSSISNVIEVDHGSSIQGGDYLFKFQSS